MLVINTNLDGRTRWFTHKNKAMDSIEVSVQIQEVSRVFRDDYLQPKANNRH